MTGELDQHGMLYDFADLKQRLRTTSAYFDHQLINDLKPFDEINPSAENIAKFIFDEMQKGLETAKLAYVRVWETETSCAVYRG
jgi:6-pyruvoyltetrahydropterin/6-carboxytetrahydropterin synthase